MKQLMTKKELSTALALSVPAINEHMKQGLPYMKLGKAVRFVYEDVLEYYKNRQKNSKGDN